MKVFTALPMKVLFSSLINKCLFTDFGMLLATALMCFHQALQYNDSMITIAGGMSLLPAGTWPTALVPVASQPQMCSMDTKKCILLVFPPLVDTATTPPGTPPPGRRLLQGGNATWPAGLNATGACFDPEADWVRFASIRVVVHSTHYVRSHWTCRVRIGLRDVMFACACDTPLVLEDR